jgi:alkanesulfonate monooxygenase SsuD/methylene tetrahydromethanopterin reductase-like flavin-dependent oxidoreductase (luciferase family)
MAETVELVRKIWRVGEQPVVHNGRFFRCHLPVDANVPPIPGGSPPILMAGGRRPLIRAAGAVADGLVGLPLATRRYVEQVVRPTLAEGARQAGRSEAVPITGLVVCVVADDPNRARRSAALQLAVYATRDSADTALAFEDFTAEAAAIRNAFAARDFAGMAAAVPERMLDRFAVFGTPHEARERYHARFASLYEHPLLYATDIGQGPGFLVENLAAICETFTYAPV